MLPPLPVDSCWLHHLVEPGRPPPIGVVLAAGRNPDDRRFAVAAAYVAPYAVMFGTPLVGAAVAWRRWNG